MKVGEIRAYHVEDTACNVVLERSARHCVEDELMLHGQRSVEQVVVVLVVLVVEMVVLVVRVGFFVRLVGAAAIFGCTWLCLAAAEFKIGVDGIKCK